MIESSADAGIHGSAFKQAGAHHRMPTSPVWIISWCRYMVQHYENRCSSPYACIASVSHQLMQVHGSAFKQVSARHHMPASPVWIISWCRHMVQHIRKLVFVTICLNHTWLMSQVLLMQAYIWWAYNQPGVYPSIYPTMCAECGRACLRPLCHSCRRECLRGGFFSLCKVANKG